MKLAGVVRQEGPRGLFQRTAGWFKRQIWYYVSYIVVYQIEPDQPLPIIDLTEQQKSAVSLKVIDSNDMQAIEELISIYRIPAAMEGILDRMRKNERCYTCYVGEQMVGYVWILLEGPVKEYEQTLFTLKTDEVYIHDAYVLPAWRGRGLYPWMKAVISRDMALQSGKKKVVSYIRRNNYASLNASRKLGGMKTGHIGCLKVRRRRFWFRFPHRPAPL